MATGFPVKANYATGDILTATNMNDLAGTVNLLTSSTLSVAAGKNAVINGGMDIWQRGTSISLAAGTFPAAYTADRWNSATGAGQACTVSRQATGDTTNLPNIQYAMRFQRNSGQTGTATLNAIQSFETTNSVPFAGKAITFSFYARAGANYSAASGALVASLYTGTGTDQNVFNGYTGTAIPLTQTCGLTTTWQRFTLTGTLSATATEISTVFAFTPVGTAGAADYFEITGVQVELGSVATSFARAGATLQGELAACQRYFYNGGNTIGSMNTSGNALFIHNLPVPMRTTPSMAFTGTATVSSPGVATYTTTTQPSSISQTQASNAQIYFAMTGMGATVASGVAYSQTLITLSAEL